MAKLAYVNLMSLNGYIGNNNYDWGNPGDSGHAFITEVMRPFGTYLYGRKTYETMMVWETPEVIPGLNSTEKEYARMWQAADKIIYSKSLERVAIKNARLERNFDPEAIRALKENSTRDIAVGGPNLAAQAIHAGIVDEYHLFLVPAMIGGGIRVLTTDLNLQLDLLDQRPMGNGWVYLKYQTKK